MHCPFCSAADTKVIDSRLVAEGDQVRRRRECLSCHERFTTFESAELVMPRVVAMTLIMPLLTVLADLIGCFGGGLISMLQVDTVRKNFEGFTKREVTQARLARQSQAMVGAPSDKDYHGLVSGNLSLRNIPFYWY